MKALIKIGTGRFVETNSLVAAVEVGGTLYEFEVKPIGEDGVLMVRFVVTKEEGDTHEGQILRVDSTPLGEAEITLAPLSL